jgi:response regulator of citrate/malate metabolism
MGQILEILISIDQKMDRLVLKGMSMTKTQSMDDEEEELSSGLDVMTLLSLPEHLRTTATVLFKTGEATAEDISKITLKERAVESGYLNQLVRMRHVRKYRTGRKVYFCINDDKKTD